MRKDQASPRLGDERPIGPGRPVGDIGVIVQRARRRVSGGRRRRQHGIGTRQRDLHRMVANLAIAMFGQLALAGAILVGLRFVLMAVMAEVRDLARLMLTIHGRHRPSVLDRQNGQQQNEQEFFHPPILASCR